MEREKLVFESSEAREIVCGDHPDYDVIEDKIYTTSRWSEHYRAVVRRNKDGKFFQSKYSVGSTEYQDNRAYDDDEPVFTEVFPVEKTITVYE